MIYRLYTFTNWMLRSIQQGIQPGHAQQELVNKYSPDFGGGPGKMQDVTASHTYRVAVDSSRYYLLTLVEWAVNHKTMICLNGGAAADIRDKALFLSKYAHSMSEQIRIYLPHATFSEDVYSLDGSMTSVAIVLPEIIFDAVDYRTAMNSVPDAKKFVEDYPLANRDGAWFHLSADKSVTNYYSPDSPVAQFLNWMKRCPLAT